jgi:phosphodiesterase/alkaline phosphatase D-like protein
MVGHVDTQRARIWYRPSAPGDFTLVLRAPNGRIKSKTKAKASKDDWHNYRHEREAIFDFLGKEKIDGCILMGGDIHVSRALRYPMKDRIGYDLWPFTTSPLHDRTIASLDVPHQYLVHHAVEPHVFTRIVADTARDPATLVATWINREGRRIFEVSLTERDLR